MRFVKDVIMRLVKGDIMRLVRGSERARESDITEGTTIILIKLTL